MKSSVMAIAAAAALWASSAAASEAPVDRRVILYPSGGQVLETWELTFQEGKAVIDLPPEAAEAALRFDLEDGSATALSVKTLPRPAQESSRIAALRGLVQEAQKRLSKAQAQRQTLEAQAEFWKSPPINSSRVSELAQIGQRAAQELQRLTELLDQTQESQRRAQQELRLAQEALAKAAPEEAPVQRQLEIQLLYGLNGTRRGTLSYSLENCGWTAGYQLEAQTEQGQVTLVRTSQVVQRSGSDWDGAQVILFSGAANGAVSPQGLSPWWIRRLEDAPAVLRSMAAEGINGGLAGPQYHEGAAAAIWDLGRRDLKSGEPLQLELNRQSWKAQFLRLAQPFQSSSAYLMAQLEPGAAPWLPPAQAQFFVNGLFICSGIFEMAPQTDEIFFGVDPAVSVTMKQQSNQSGRQGLLSSEQTRTWDWAIEVVNGHRVPLKVRVQDALPQSSDQDLVVSVESTPQASTKDQLLFWDLDLAAGEKRVLRHSVTFKAPRDMRIHPGR